MRGRDADIIIVGAGIGGLTAALALHARGYDRIAVLEAAKQIRAQGVGINIQPAAVGILSELGLAEAMDDTAIATRELWYVDHTGTKLWADPRGLHAGEKYPQYSIHRGELQMLLLRAVQNRLGPDAVRTCMRLERIEQDDTSVRAVVLNRGTGATHELAAAAVIGADGINSAVRAQLHPRQCDLAFANVHMWRGVTELAKFLDGRTMIVANDEHSNRLIAYPISAHTAGRGRALVNWVCMVPNARAAVTGEAGWDCPGSLADVLPHFSHWNLGWVSVRELLEGSESILEYPMVDRDPLRGWRVGRVTLLGDAAHLMYPVGANGASQAIIDASRLAAELAAGGGITAALDRYESARRGATTAIIHANRDRDRAERAIVTQPSAGKSAALADITQTYRNIVERPQAAANPSGEFGA
jgi:2-polyprenyl-6-methoxyphenol hydroxylase-like FAD-dependent oxidoreductase